MMKRFVFLKTTATQSYGQMKNQLPTFTLNIMTCKALYLSLFLLPVTFSSCSINPDTDTPHSQAPCPTSLCHMYHIHYPLRPQVLLASVRNWPSGLPTGLLYPSVSLPWSLLPTSLTGFTTTNPIYLSSESPGENRNSIPDLPFGLQSSPGNSEAWAYL